MNRSSPGLRRAFQLLFGVVVTLSLAWFAGRPILVSVAAFLVEEDPLVPGEILVVSNRMRDAALEAALLYQEKVSSRIVMTDWIHNPMLEKQRLGIPYSGTLDASKAILERSGVPSSAITVLPDQVDGTESEVSAIAAFAARRQLVSLLVITARSHTARTKWLLQRKLGSRTRVSVRSPRFDRFSVDAWWRQRDHRQEVLAEYLRWFNTAVLGDRGRRPSSG